MYVSISLLWHFLTLGLGFCLFTFLTIHIKNKYQIKKLCFMYVKILTSAKFCEKLFKCQYFKGGKNQD